MYQEFSEKGLKFVVLAHPIQQAWVEEMMLANLPGVHEVVYSKSLSKYEAPVIMADPHPIRAAER